IDPDLPAPLDVPGHGHPGRLDLSVRDPPGLQGQKAVVTEVDLGAALGLSSHAAAVLLAMLDPLRHEGHLRPPSSETSLRRAGATGRTTTTRPGRATSVLAVPGLRGWQGTGLDLPNVSDQRAGGGASHRDAGHGPGPKPSGLLLLGRDLVAVVDPHLHADHAEGGLGLGR